MDYDGQRSREYSRGQLYLCANTEQFLWDHHKTHICAWPLKACLGSWLCQNGSPQEMQQAQPPSDLQGSLRTTERIWVAVRCAAVWQDPVTAPPGEGGWLREPRPGGQSTVRIEGPGEVFWAVQLVQWAGETTPPTYSCSLSHGGWDPPAAASPPRGLWLLMGGRVGSAASVWSPTLMRRRQLQLPYE